MVDAFRILLLIKANISSQPIHYAWDRIRPSAKGHCFQQVPFLIGSGSVNAFLNFVIFLLVSLYQLFMMAEFWEADQYRKSHCHSYDAFAPLWNNNWPW